MPFSEVEIPDYNPLFSQIRSELTSPHNFAPVKSVLFKTIRRIHLFTRIWSISEVEQKGIIIIFHGAGGDGEYYALLADKICNMGLIVAVCDYEGHGRSEGKRGDIKDFKTHISNAKEFIDALIEEYPKIPVFLFGESMGGVVLVNLLIEYAHELSDRILGNILFSPALRFRKGSIKLGVFFRNLIPVVISLMIPGKATISMRPEAEFAQSRAASFMHPLHIQYDVTDPMHLEKVSIRSIAQLNKYADRAFKQGAKYIMKPSICFLGDKDVAVGVDSIERFFSAVNSSSNTIIRVQNGPHALFTAPAFQSYWNVLINWIFDHL